MMEIQVSGVCPCSFSFSLANTIPIYTSADSPRTSTEHDNEMVKMSCGIKGSTGFDNVRMMMRMTGCSQKFYGLRRW